MSLAAGPGPSPLRAGLSLVVGAALLAATNAIAIAATVPWPLGGLRARLLHHLWDAAGTIGLGVLAALLVGAGARAVDGGRGGCGGSRTRRIAGLAVYAGVAAAIMSASLGHDLHRQARIPFGSRLEAPLLALYVALCGMAVPAAHAIGAALAAAPAAPRWTWLRRAAMGAALAAMAANHFFLRDDHPGVHGAVAWTAATLAGAALGARAEALARRLRPRAAAGAAAAIGATALFAFAATPPNEIRVELFREPCAVAAWALAAARWESPSLRPGPGATPDERATPWWRDRRDMAPVPPTRPPLAPGVAPVVVLITVDAMRGDVIGDPANDASLPALAELKRTGAYFPRAVAPGSQTAVSLSAAFSGRYFSQLVWSMFGRGDMRFAYPAADPARRFPEILADRGVATASVCSLNFLAGDYGVVRGFQEEQVVAQGRHHAPARAVVGPLIERLQRAGDGPLFAYAHLTEPHSPYDRGVRKGSAWERYLSEIRVADAQLGRIASLLARRFPDRGYLFVTSDHGEAFGEHGTREHSKTLYEELLRVPLLVRGPGVVARRVEPRVGLIDLGPTVLDLFGLETPASFLGQSLVPLLGGQDAVLDRPLLAEGRLRRALYAGDLKVIDDPRRKVVEAFDLARDPREERNLFDAEPDRVAPALAALRAFFEVHRAAQPGYEPPYRP